MKINSEKSRSGKWALVANVSDLPQTLRKKTEVIKMCS